jgi:hypothetical protein
LKVIINSLWTLLPALSPLLRGDARGQSAQIPGSRADAAARAKRARRRSGSGRQRGSGSGSEKGVRCARDGWALDVPRGRGRGPWAWPNTILICMSVCAFVSRGALFDVGTAKPPSMSTWSVCERNLRGHRAICAEPDAFLIGCCHSRPSVSSEHGQEKRATASKESTPNQQNPARVVPSPVRFKGPRCTCRGSESPAKDPATPNRKPFPGIASTSTVLPDEEPAPRRP